MSHIRSKDTRPELLVRKALFAAGFRFRVNVSSLPGTPDIVLRKYNTAIFVNGCFWHGHPGCRLYTVPKSNTRFWQEKVEKNKRRDAAVTLRLEARGWNVITVWECSLDSSHRQDTIASLVLQIRGNGRKAGLESAERRERLAAARKEAADRRVRRSDLEEEISKTKYTTFLPVSGGLPSLTVTLSPTGRTIMTILPLISQIYADKYIFPIFGMRHINGCAIFD